MEGNNCTERVCANREGKKSNMRDLDTDGWITLRYLLQKRDMRGCNRLYLSKGVLPFIWPKTTTVVEGSFEGRTCKKSVKKVKQTHYRPEQAQRVGRSVALLFRDLGARSGWVVSLTPRPL
jgi:hypothetical protein